MNPLPEAVSVLSLVSLFGKMRGGMLGFVLLIFSLLATVPALAQFSFSITSISPACGAATTPITVNLSWTGNTGNLDTVIGFGTSTTPSCSDVFVTGESCSGTNVTGATNISGAASGTYAFITTVPAGGPFTELLVGIELSCGSVGTEEAGTAVPIIGRPFRSRPLVVQPIPPPKRQQIPQLLLQPKLPRRVRRPTPQLLPTPTHQVLRPSRQPVHTAYNAL